MKKQIVSLITSMISMLLLASTSRSATMTDNFNNGINLNTWEIFNFSASDAPWTIQAPDEQGGLRISKLADNDSTLNVYGLIQSRFILDGDLSVSVDFDLLTFPLANKPNGWNEAVIRLVGTTNNNDIFSCLRFANYANQYTEGFSYLPPYVFGETIDQTLTGKFIIKRVDSTVSAWIDRGAGPILLGSLTSEETKEPVKVQIFAGQIPQFGIRPTTALDVRFDNFSATAETIVPEPATLLLFGLGLGGLAMLRKHRV